MAESTAPPPPAASGWARARSAEAVRSGIRFAVAITLADALVWWVFRSGTPVVLGSFAVISLLYFLDFEGSRRERLGGYLSALGIGAVAVIAGTLLAQPLWLAVLGALVISSAFAFMRVLRGYAAKSAVGLQGAFFLPLMTTPGLTELPSLVGSWLLGGAVAVTVGMAVLPHQRSGLLRAGLSAWLMDAASLIDVLTTDGPADVARRRLHDSRAALLRWARGPQMRPGSVGSRERALAELLDGVRWHSPLLEELAPLPPGDDTQLAHATSTAFDCAAHAVSDPHPPNLVPDLTTARDDDLDRLAASPDIDPQQHYAARLASITAMRMLWLAGISRGVSYHEPNLGSVADRTPWALVRENARPDSIWLRNALRTGAASAVCVLLVRELGLTHGLWVVLAALTVTQVSFSGSANGNSAVKVAAGAIAGVLVASLGVILEPPLVVYVLLVPIAAFLAVIASRVGAFTAQFFYTPFALINLAALQWTSDRALELVRVEDVILGVAIAALFAFAVFPYGLARIMREQARHSEALTRGFLQLAVSSARGATKDDAERQRSASVQAVSLFESTIDAALLRPTLPEADLTRFHDVDADCRSRILGGDACCDLAARASKDSRLAPVAASLATWWENRLLTPARDRGHE